MGDLWHYKKQAGSAFIHQSRRCKLISVRPFQVHMDMHIYVPLQTHGKAAVTHIFSLFFTFFDSTPQKSEKSRSHTKKFHFFIKTPKVHFSLFFTLGENGGWSQEAPNEGSNRANPLETPWLGFCTLERTCTLGECLRRQGFHT